MSKTINDFEECPHCGSDFGYYTKAYVSGWVHNKTLFQRDPVSGKREKYNHELHDHLNWSRETKYCFCIECDNRIAKKI